MSFAEERLHALTQKQAVLRTSLEAWLDKTTDARTRQDPAFQIHYVQTREVDRLMDGLRRLVATVLDEAAAGRAVVERGAAIESAILAGCQVWEFFRTRLAQRLDPGLRTFLRVADEVAWQCYRPVRDLALGDSPLCKAPPLVYLNSAWSPFTVTRNREYAVESVPRAFMRNADFRTAVSRLPFPVIAVPWYQVAYLPDAVAICHEIGHSVEADFDLDLQVAACIDAAVPEARAAAWKARGSELFADFYGCLSVGPAYAWALANILLADGATVRIQSDPAYPSCHGRMIFNAAVLSRMGLAVHADAFSTAWRAMFPDGSAAASDDEDADVRAIAASFTGAPARAAAPGIVVGGRSLTAAFGFTPTQQEEVDQDVAALVAGGEPSSADIRVLCASAVFASRQPGFTRQARLLETMRAACVDERRNDEAALVVATGRARQAHLATVGARIARDLLGDVAPAP